MTKITPELEKVARALFEFEWTGTQGLVADWAVQNDDERAYWYKSARAALEAIRDPSEGMRAIIERRFPCDTNISRILIDHILGKETGG